MKKRANCRLILAGETAEDDPQGSQVLMQVKEEAKGDSDIHILNPPPEVFAINIAKKENKSSSV